MMSDYEPASGWNLPPGCRDRDIDRSFGEDEGRECGQCPEWEACPCGCGRGWCHAFMEFTEEGEGCES